MKNKYFRILMIFVLLISVAIPISINNNYKERPVVIIGYSQSQKEKIFGDKSDVEIREITDKIGRDLISKGYEGDLSEEFKEYANQLDIKYIDKSKNLDLKL